MDRDDVHGERGAVFLDVVVVKMKGSRKTGEGQRRSLVQSGGRAKVLRMLSSIRSFDCVDHASWCAHLVD